MSATTTFEVLGDDPRATLGLVIDFSRPSAADLIAALPAREWQEVARAAADARAFLVAAGRPFTVDAGGFYVVVRREDDVPTAALAANTRMRAAESSGTIWVFHTDDALRAAVLAALGTAVRTEGSA